MNRYEFTSFCAQPHWNINWTKCVLLWKISFPCSLSQTKHGNRYPLLRKTNVFCFVHPSYISLSNSCLLGDHKCSFSENFENISWQNIHARKGRGIAFHFSQIQLAYCLHLQNGFRFLTKYLNSDQRSSRNIVILLCLKSKTSMLAQLAVTR